MRSYAGVYGLVTLSVLLTVAQSQDHIRTKRRMYAMCPPTFQRIGSECYAISDQRANWLEAHFQCKDKNSKLAEPDKNSDRKLRSFFQKMDHDPDEIWIGATFDWQCFAWQWSISGKNLTYDAFSRMKPESRQNLEYHCAVFNPSLKYRWSARSCVDKHRYICQHKMPKVSKKNRIKVYNRWNQTYPNQLANEVILEVIDTKTKDGKRTHRRVKPIDSGENYPIRSHKRPHQIQARPSLRPLVQDTDSDINVRFYPNSMSNEINGANNHHTAPTVLYPLTMDFITGDLSTSPADVQAAQSYPDTTTTRSRKNTNDTVGDNETVEEAKPKSTTPRKRVRTKFDRMADQKRRQERERRRSENARRKLLREKNLRAKEEAERKRKQQAEIDELKLKQAEEEKQMKEQEMAAKAQREKLETQRENEKKQQALKEAEEKRWQEQQEEEEERQKKQRSHEENRLRLEQEEKIKQIQSARELQLEEERRVSEENRLRAEHEERLRQIELKRLQEEDEKRLELQRIEVERKREEEELARLEEENRKRLAAQKVREEEIRRREEQLEQQVAEENRLQEELKLREEQDRLLREQELQRDVEEKKQKEEAEKQERAHLEELRRLKEEKLKKKIEIEAQQLQEEEDRKKKEKIRKYAERISRLSPEAQRIFIEARRRRKKNKNSDNEATIPERK